MQSLSDISLAQRLETTSSSMPMKDASAKLLSDLDLSGEKIREVMLRNFNAIDTNKDNRLSQKEIDAFKPVDEDALAHYYVRRRVHDIASIQKESFFPSNKITRDDLDQFAIKESPKLASSAKRYGEYTQVLLDNFKIIDTDNSKMISKEELNEALSNPDLDVGAKQTVRFFRDNYEATTMALKPAFVSKPELYSGTLDQTKEIFDFKSMWASPWNRVALPAGGAIIGGGGAAFWLWRGSLFAAEGAKPTSRAYAIAAGIGALVGGAYFFATALGQDKTIPKSRLALFNALSSEMDQGIASPLAGSPASAEKVKQKELAQQRMDERWGVSKPAQPVQPVPKEPTVVVVEKPGQPPKLPETWIPSSGMGGNSTRLLREIK